MSDVAGLAWLVVLLLVNGFFVGAEFAVISVRRSQIEPRAEAGGRAAKTTLYAMENASMMLATSQLGITVCSLLILNVSEPALHHMFAGPLELTGLPDSVLNIIGFVIALVLVSFLHVVLGEMVPKNLSFSAPARAALILAPPLVFVSLVFRPVIIALNATANSVVRLFGVIPKAEANSTFTVDEVANIVAQSKKEGVLTDTIDQLTAAFEFTTKKVADIAVGMASLVTLTEQATPADVEKAVASSGFSRYVVLDGDNEPTGYLHLKDVLDLEHPEEFIAAVPESRLRTLISLAPEVDLEDALAAMRRSGVHLARVVNSAQVTVGVLFLEDIIEELVGEVHDATQRTKLPG